MGIGGLSGAASFGIGEAFQAAYGSKLTLGQSVLKVGIHGHVQGTLGVAQGGNYVQSFAAGAAGSAFGSAFGEVSGKAGIQLGINAAGGALIGGGASAWAGGDFWEGAAIGATVSVANHWLHRQFGKGDENCCGDAEDELAQLLDEYDLGGKTGDGFDELLGRFRRLFANESNNPYDVNAIVPDLPIGPGGPVKAVKYSNWLFRGKDGVYRWIKNGRVASRSTLKRFGLSKPNLTTSRGKAYKLGNGKLQPIINERVPDTFFGKVGYYWGKALKFFHYDGSPPGL